MQEAIAKLLELGPMPSSEGSDVAVIEEYETLLSSVVTPVSDEEAIELVKVFGPDDCFEISWTLIHIIESAPGWPVTKVLSSNDQRDGVQALRSRAGLR